MQSYVSVHSWVSSNQARNLFKRILLAIVQLLQKLDNKCANLATQMVECSECEAYHKQSSVVLMSGEKS